MKKPLQLWFCLLLLWGAWPHLAQAEGFGLEKAEALLQNLAGFQAHFTQTSYDSLKDQSSKAQGVFWYRKPGLMRWQYQFPEEMLVVVGQSKVWIYDPILENVTIQSKAKMTNSRSLSFLFGQARLSQLYQVIQPKKDHLGLPAGYARLALTPLESNPEVLELQLAFDPKSGLIKAFALLDASLNLKLIVFEQIKTSPLPPLQDFDFTPPEGIEMIDGMGN